MDNLVNEVFEIVKDYRSDEGASDVYITKSRIRHWVEQFEEGDREFILEELKNIFSKYYCSKAKAMRFLKNVVDKLTEDLKYKTPQDFLTKSFFLNLQPEGKSQKIMLSNLREILATEYDFDMKESPSDDVKHFIYIDDILCTGNTLFQDIKEWCEESYNGKVKNINAINNNQITLICAFIFIHEKNYFKKKAEMKHKISEGISEKHKMYRMVEVENSISKVNSKLDFVFPVEANQSALVSEYKGRIVVEVDEYTKRYNNTSKEEFYRVEGRPQTEKLFSSPENRIRLEKILLEKGISILGRADTRVKNMRALGFSLPSQKDFGFGTLCFTWRNVANNTPLVFWYAGGGFYPLFVKNHTN